MISLIRSSFVEAVDPEALLSVLTPYLIKDEKVIKIFESIDFFAHFTNKRIIFTYRIESSLKLRQFEIEFLPYKSIERFSYIYDEKLSKGAIQTSIVGIGFLSFVIEDKSIGEDFAKAIGEYTA